MLVVIAYTGIVYYERKKDNTYEMGFVAAIGTNFKSLVEVRKFIAQKLCYLMIMQYIKDQHRIIKLVNFDFDPNSDIIKLNLKEISFSNWTVEPQSYEVMFTVSFNITMKFIFTLHSCPKMRLMKPVINLRLV